MQSVRLRSDESLVNSVAGVDSWMPSRAAAATSKDGDDAEAQSLSANDATGTERELGEVDNDDDDDDDVLIVEDLGGDDDDA
jgi:hypothetical protein